MKQVVLALAVAFAACTLEAPRTSSETSPTQAQNPQMVKWRPGPEISDVGICSSEDYLVLGADLKVPTACAPLDPDDGDPSDTQEAWGSDGPDQVERVEGIVE